MEAVTYGPHALLLRFARQADEAAFERGREWVAELGRQPLAGLREVVPAFTTLLLNFDTPGSREAAAGVIQKLRGPGSDETSSSSASRSNSSVPASRLREIRVRYAGPDLGRIAEHARLSAEEVIERHLAPVYRVRCLGFSPGFPYLGGLDPQLHTPRLATPRPRVPAGSVAIGGEHTGIYSVPSPGGWNLIGETPSVLFDPRESELETMFLLRAGDRVKFVPTRNPEAGTRNSKAVLGSEPASAGSLRVLSVGLGITIQDLGRPGFARFGVPPGGAMDPQSAAWANRLLDNAPDAAVLELCLQGQRFEVLRDGWLAVTGANAPRGGSRNHSFRAHVGDGIEFGPPTSGIWSYLAVHGGFAGDVVLGSRSVNPRAGIGRPFGIGDEPGATEDHELVLPHAVAGRVVPWDEAPDFASPPTFRVWRGPQWDSFSEADRERFTSAVWTVSSQSDRVGYRLVGPTFESRLDELVSEPVLPGSIQVPANGQPIVTMADGPTLGGYPKLGLVDPAELPRLAQCRPGQPVRFQRAE